MIKFLKTIDMTQSPIQRPIRLVAATEREQSGTVANGKVYLVGAGPGDPELITLKAYRLLQSADVVLYDALISDDILEMITDKAKRIDVGKRANSHMTEQVEINQQMVQLAKQGAKVIRLKGGDPFIFGRGGEECQYLRQHQVHFEVVPGITAASGCASYAGIPLTHRDYAQSVSLVTAHQKDGSNVNWSKLATEKQTIVFYMGLMKNQIISNSLIANGLKAGTPVAVVENGTRHNQRVFNGTIDQLSNLVKENNIQMPALIIVGEVATLSKNLSWFEKGSHDDFRLADHPLAVAK